MPCGTPSGSQDLRWHRLSALDAAFLAIEDEQNPMNIGATAVFEPGSLLDERGRVREPMYLRYVEGILTRLPKWRLRLARVPLLGHPVLIAYPELELRRHVHFVHLERGTRADLDRLASELYSHTLDRSRPLWEQLVVDGLAHGGFAVITKLHHAMADGVAGFGALAKMLSASPEPAPGGNGAGAGLEPPLPAELLRAELRFRASEPRALFELARRAVREPERVREAARTAVGGLLSAARASARPAPATPINPRHIGSRRTYLGSRMDLEAVKRVRRAAGCTLNDVVLTTAAGALQRYFELHHVALGGRELRCMVPVSLHEPGSADVLGNEVSLMLVPLPVERVDPEERLARVADNCRAAKRAEQSGALALAEHLAEWTAASFVPWSIRAVIGLRPFNLIVTNVPGPPFSLYLLDSKMIEVYPMVPLYRNQALGIALVSYEGGLYWGLSADADRLDDVGAIAAALEPALGELQALQPPGEAWH